MKVEAVRTPATKEQIARAIVVAWWHLLQEPPTREAVMLMTAQSAFECGWWHSMWNFNIGNQKSAQRAGDWYFIRCSELLDPARAESLRAADPSRVSLGLLINVAKPGEPPKMRRSVTFKPDHPACCFRAHATLEDGVTDHVRMMFDNFESAIAPIKAGDLSGAVEALAGRYFTDPAPHYEFVWRDCLRQLGDLEIDLSPPPADTTGALAAVQAASLQQASWDALREDERNKG